MSLFRRSISVVLFLSTVGWAQEQGERRRFDREKVHDPSTIIESDGVYRFFCTGRGVKLMRETEDGQRLTEGQLFDRDAIPAWHGNHVPENRGHLWAPDVIQIGEQFFVYYSVSTFGKNTSAIGLAVGKTLDPKSPQWSWEDRGPVILSKPTDRFNAIDPAVFRDPDSNQFVMTFGSFWDGLFLIELDSETGLRADDAEPVHLAKAPEIEAPFLCRGPSGDYFLFLNWGKCCRGVRSTYEIRVGRSKKVTGPFLDRDGTDLRDRGGTLVAASAGRHIGPGHASILQRDDKEWLVHHFYDGDHRGRSRLRMLELQWDAEGWPQVTTTTNTTSP